MVNSKEKKAKDALSHPGQYQHSMMCLKLNGGFKNGLIIENEASSCF
jgi:hypothetical protein